MEYFVILTLQVPTSTGFAMRTTTATVSLDPGATRVELLEWMLSKLPESHRRGNIVFFSAEPNELPVRRFTVAGAKERQR